MTEIGPGAGETSALLALAQWLEALVLSPLAASLAVLAVAATGLSMLSGRLPVRRGLTVVFGCFIVFGAPALARGIVGSTASLAGSDQVETVPEPVFVPPERPPRPTVADPYAGASVADTR